MKSIRAFLVGTGNLGTVKVRPVQFGALPAAAEQLFTKPQSRPKSEPNLEALSWLFLMNPHKIRTNPGV